MGCENCKSNQYEALDKFVEGLEYKDSSSLIEVLHFAQHEYGFLPKEIQIYVAKLLGVPEAQVYGVITFYSYFTDVPRGEFLVQVCMGTGCFVKGSDKVLKAFEQKLGVKSSNTTEDMKFTLDGVRCVGACGLAPVVIINEKVYGHVKVDDVPSIIEDCLIRSAG